MGRSGLGAQVRSAPFEVFTAAAKARCSLETVENPPPHRNSREPSTETTRPRTVPPTEAFHPETLLPVFASTAARRMWPAPFIVVNLPPTKTRLDVAASARTGPLALGANPPTSCPVAAPTAATRPREEPATWVKSPPR